MKNHQPNTILYQKKKLHIRSDPVFPYYNRRLVLSRSRVVKVGKFMKLSIIVETFKIIPGRCRRKMDKRTETQRHDNCPSEKKISSNHPRCSVPRNMICILL